MTMIANCRAELYEDAYPLGFSHKPKDEKNPYWEGFLHKPNKTFIAGYDEAVETMNRGIVNNILDNEFLGYVVPETDHKQCQEMFEKLTIWDETGGEDLTKEKFFEIVEKYPAHLRVLAALWVDLQVNAEVHRNEIITSMIDGQEENENEQ